MERLFKKEFLQEDVLEEVNSDVKIVQDEVIDFGRWSVLHDLVFGYENKFWNVSYSRGATEQQYESPFEHDSDEISCTEVQPIQKTITTYIPVDTTA